MLKTVKNALFLSIFLLTFSQANLIELKKSEYAQFEELELLKRNSITVEKAFNVGELYILKISAQGAKDEIFVTKDKKYVISGTVINSSNGTQLKSPVDLTPLKNKEAFIYGNGDKELILFTDPQCPYCKKFESYFEQIKDKVKIKVFFYPLDFHKEARDISKYILSQKTTKEKIDAFFEFEIGDDLTKIKNMKYSKSQNESLEKILDEHLKLGTNLGVQGTPALFDKDGNSIVWVKLLSDYNISVK